MASSVIMCSFSVWLIWPVSVGTTTSLDDTTSISCFAKPTCNEIFGIFMLPPWVIVISRCSQVLNPAAEMFNVYVEGRMAAKLKNPELFDIVSRFVFVASSMSTTVAFGITALLASATVPLIDPVAFWPGSDKLQNRNRTTGPGPKKPRDGPAPVGFP